MSDLLKAFLAEYLSWVEAGAYDREPFANDAGLCHNFSVWMRGLDISPQNIKFERDQLESLFVSEGLDKEYPFGGRILYCDEGFEGTMHLNPRRVKWVRSKVARPTPDESGLGRAVRLVRGGALLHKSPNWLEICMTL